MSLGALMTFELLTGLKPKPDWSKDHKQSLLGLLCVYRDELVELKLIRNVVINAVINH